MPKWMPAQETWTRISDTYWNWGVISPDGSAVACGYYTVKLFRASDGAFIRTLFAGDSRVEKMQFDASGERFLAANQLGWRVIRVSDGVVLLDVNSDYASSSALSPDGSILIVNDNQVGGRAYNVADGTVRYTFSHNIGVPANISPYYTSGLTLYDFYTGNLIRTLTPPPFSNYWGYWGAISKDDSKYAMPVGTGSEPNAVALWDLSQNASPKIIQGANYGRVCFLRGDSKLTTSVSNGTNVYDLSTLQLERNLPNVGALSSTADGLHLRARARTTINLALD